MDPERWLRIRQLFDASVRLAPAERSAFLADACMNDSALRRDLEALVASHGESGGFLETPYEMPLLGNLEGRRLGAYELGPLIGAGGMGDVYRARDTRLNRTVAIKVRADRFVERADLQEQFARESRAISALNHPRICHLLDVGRHDSIDYLVMEYVEGEPIDEYCNRRRLGTRARLEMFCAVCEAVDYAHRNLVVHRDLKPANILITTDGQPKLLDFGIAKMLDATAASVAGASTFSQALTPEYASPEQIRGEAVTTAADVYALGMVLYELLAGCRPYDVRTGSLEHIVHMVCEVEPPPPSSALRDTAPGARPVSVAAKELLGDLDTIVLKALRKEPERRYLSVQALAADIARFLAGQPVAARGDALSYRLAKFFARHRAAALVAALFLIGLMVSMTMIVRQSRIAEVQRHRAERRFADVRKLAGSFLFEFHDAIKNLPGSTSARQLVTTRALQYLDSLADESAGDLTLRAELARAYQQVADIQGGYREANLGNLGGAMSSYQKALGLQEELVRARPDDRLLRRDLARTVAALGDVQFSMRDESSALSSFRRSLSIRSELAAAAPDDRALQRDIAGSHYRIADAARILRDAGQADRSLQEAIGILKGLSTDATDLESRQMLARCYKKVGMIRAITGDNAGNLSMVQESLRLIQEVASTDPLNVTLRNEVAMSQIEVGRAQLRVGHLVDALDSLHRAEAISAAMAQADPRNVQAKWTRGLELNLVGVILRSMHREMDAVASHLEARQILEEVAGADPSNEWYRYNVANTFQLIGDAYVAMAQKSLPRVTTTKAWVDARLWYRRSADAFDAMRRRGTLAAAFSADADKVAAGLALAERKLASAPATSKTSSPD